MSALHNFISLVEQNAEAEVDKSRVIASKVTHETEIEFEDLAALAFHALHDTENAADAVSVITKQVEQAGKEIAEDTAFLAVLLASRVVELHHV